MKHLTAFITGIAILFSLSSSVWAKAEAPNEAAPPAAETPLTLGASSGGTVNPEDNVVAENGSGAVMDVNNGVVEINNGTIDANNGTVIVNTGFLVNSASGDTAPEVTFNTGEAIYFNSPDEVKYNAGEVFRDYPHGDDFERTSYYGVVYANENGDGLLLPEALCEQLLSDGAEAEAVLSGLVESGDLIFSEAVSDSGDPALNGVITLLTEAEAPFRKSGYDLDGWMDANQNNAPYALGATVTVTAPLWLIPRWVLIQVTPPAEESGSVDPTPPQAQESKATYVLVPAPAGNNTVWDFSNVTFTSSDERVAMGSISPTPTLTLSSDLTELLRSCPLKVEFDGESLPSGYFSLSYRQDGTAVLLFSRTFVSSLPDGEHDIVLILNDTEIAVTMLLAAPTAEESPLRARKADHSGAFTNMPQSSAAGQKGKSG